MREEQMKFGESYVYRSMCFLSWNFMHVVKKKIAHRLGGRHPVAGQIVLGIDVCGGMITLPLLLDPFIRRLIEKIPLLNAISCDVNETKLHSE